MTARIRHLQHLVATNTRNSKRRRAIKILVKERYEILSHLREADYKCYEWVLEKLDLQFKPPPMEPYQITRKDGLRRLTTSYCDNIKNTRLNDYRKQLEAQQLPFLAEKLKNLEFMRNEQLDMGVKVTVTEDEIADVRQKYEEMKAKQDEVPTEEVDAKSSRKWKSY